MVGVSRFPRLQKRGPIEAVFVRAHTFRPRRFHAYKSVAPLKLNAARSRSIRARRFHAYKSVALLQGCIVMRPARHRDAPVHRDALPVGDCAALGDRRGLAFEAPRSDDLPILQERLGESLELRPVRRQDRLGGVLRQVNAAHLAGAVRPTAVEAHTGEHCDAARRRGGPGQREKAQNNLHVRGQGGALDGLVLKEGLTQVTCARRRASCCMSYSLRSVPLLC